MASWFFQSIPPVALEVLDGIATQKSLWEKIEAYQWDDINAPYWQNKYQDLQSDITMLEASGGDLAQAELHWQDAKDKLKQIQSELRQLESQQGGIKNSLNEAGQQEAKAQAQAAPGMMDATREMLFQRVGPLSLEDLSQLSTRLLEIEKELDVLLDRERSKKSVAENTANGVMSSFRGKDQWQVFTVDWPTGLAALPDFLDHLNQLNREGLPTLVEQFVERLNKHATQSLARIKSKLDSEREEIIDRINTINEVLQRTEFKQGSHLKLGSHRERYPHVIDFDKQLGLVLSQVTSDEHEARFLQLAKVVEILEKASAVGTSTTLESLRLLDPRYRLSFYAEEVDRLNGEVRDVLDSSSGKSGGEKESFAGTIVAASLAYVLTPDGHEQSVYCTVFLDEAFSNMAEAFARRILFVFKELNLHINLITPYTKLNIAREAARSLVIVEKDQNQHDSHLCEVTWEQIDRKLQAKKEKQMAEAVNLGIELIQTETDYEDDG